MPESELAFAGVAGQLELLRRGEVSSRDLVELSLARVAALDPELNAFGAVYVERARADADGADARRAAGEDAPLLGLPVAVKDEIDIAGEVTSRGTAAFTDRAAEDAEVVRRLRAAGAVVVGKTTMPELGLWPFTESVTWGVTRNPWDVERTPGGSSGGSAAAVAAGIVPAAIGADGAGSIRIPAACTGLFGLKPQSGRVPRAPHDRDRSHWIVYGPLTRSVIDTAIVLDAIRGPMPGDAAPLPEPARPFADSARADPGALRIAVSSAFPAGVQGRLAPEVRGALDRTVELLRELGHTVVERDVDFRPRDAPVILGLLFRAIHDFVAEVDRPARLERRSRALARPGRADLRPHAGAAAGGGADHDRARRAAVGRPRRPADARAVPAGRAGGADGGARRDRHLPVGDLVGAVQRPLERDRPARRVGARRLHRGGPAARGPDRRAPERRGDAAVARRAARVRPAVGGPAPAYRGRALSRLASARTPVRS